MFIPLFIAYELLWQLNFFSLCLSNVAFKVCTLYWLLVPSNEHFHLSHIRLFICFIIVSFLQNEAFKLKQLLYFLAKSRNRRIKNKPERFIFPFKDKHFEFGVDEDPTLTSVSSVLPQHNNRLHLNLYL